MSENPHSEWHSDDELASSLEDVIGRLGKVEAAADASDTGRVELLEQAAAEAAVADEPVFEPASGAPVAAYSDEDSAEVTAIIESYIDDDDDDESDPTDAFAAFYADAAPAAGVVATEVVVTDVVAPTQDAPPEATFAPAGYVPGQTDEVIVTTSTTSTTSTMFHVSDTRYEKPKRPSFDEVFFGRSTAPASTPEQ